MEEKKFALINQKAWLGGVCAGIAYYFEMPTWLVRLLFFTIGGPLSTLYIGLWIFVPRYEIDPEDYEKICE